MPGLRGIHFHLASDMVDKCRHTGEDLGGTGFIVGQGSAIGVFDFSIFPVSGERTQQQGISAAEKKQIIDLAEVILLHGKNQVGTPDHGSIQDSGPVPADVGPVAGGRQDGKRLRPIAVEAMGACRSNRNRLFQGFRQLLAKQPFRHGAAADIARTDHEY
jgi:hypothetical protein